MRVTQNMLSNSNLGYISKNYERLGKLQDQINTGKKITKPSDDPVVAMKGMRYRSQLTEVKQFYRNLTEGFTWMENADAALDETGQVLHRIRELTVQASNDSYDPVARGNIEKEINRLQEHLVAMANTKIGDNYIFNGTKTDKAPVNSTLFNLDFSKTISDMNTEIDDPSNTAEDLNEYLGTYTISYQGQTYKFGGINGKKLTFNVEPQITYKTVDPVTEIEKLDNQGYIASLTIDLSDLNNIGITQTALEEQKNLNGGMVEVTKNLNESDLVLTNTNAVSTNNQDVEIEVMKGVRIPVNVPGSEAFSVDLFGGLESIKKMLTNPETSGQEITKALDSIDKFINNVVSTRAELGARQNRAEMVEDRLLKQQIVAEQTVSDNEDIDFEKAIIDLTIQESVHRASLAVGARIIQPTLMDFLG